ncbi:MAG: diacylglycerol kinase family lipid kinase [Tissierellia bacterium]|nr:diacylglycerol kinase family lipid kinase [Tissierellia bacterium]
MRKVLAVINPSSGDETAKDYHDVLNHQLQKYFDEVEIRYTEKAGDAKNFARIATTDHVHSIVSFGGDGTVNEIISGISTENYRPKLCVLPGGTVNAVSRILKMPMNKKRAIETMDFTSTKFIDIGSVNDHFFALSCSVGDVSDAIHDASIDEKSRLGPLAYFKDAFEEFVKMSLYDFQMIIDGHPIEGQFSNIMVCLSNEIVGKIITEEVKANDGEFLLLAFGDIKGVDLLELSYKTLTKNIEDSRSVKAFHGKNIEIRCDAPMDYDIDGDKGGSLPISISILPGHLEMYGHF